MTTPVGSMAAVTLGTRRMPATVVVTMIGVATIMATSAAVPATGMTATGMTSTGMAAAVT